MQHDSPSFYPFTCSACHARYNLFAQQKALFCPICGHPLQEKIPTSSTPLDAPTAIGPYQLINSIGKGGMGEVFLAYDTSCGRQIALKKIRADLKEHPQIHRRFLKEARITCQLTHPAIIPIYTIHEDGQVYYTMPFVEGETLKQIIRKTRQQEKRGEKLDHIGGSIPALMRIFMAICQAVAYAHSKGVLHRDLKPENIIIGKYGEVLILDWGLAKFIDQPSTNQPSEDSIDTHPPAKSSQRMDITHVGKIVGTIAYMAPERASNDPSTIQTDIYSLGVILYQLLSLRMPFKRKSLAEFKKTVHTEQFIDPISAAPHRDIPRLLSRITEKCLAVDPSQRYPSVDELILELENYTEGRSEWFHMAQLDVKRKKDWEFQENILIAEHMAITRITEEAEWVSLMISRSSFAGNMKIEAEVYLKENSHGIGFLISVPEASERSHINDGYCLWLGSDIYPFTKLLRCNAEVMQAPDIFLKRHQKYKVCFEKVEQTIHVYIDDVLQFSHIAYIPLIGTHIGLLSRDAEFEISPLDVSVGSLNIMVNCLAVPDAFLAQRDFTQALSEYRRIAYSFPDRAEGREAIFRAGLTLIEQAQDDEDKEALLELALKEFEKLHGTPGAPLEYLGKGLVYQTLNDYEEEIKCFELAYRRYPKHPLLSILQEQILSRLHELSRSERMAAYHLILLAVRHLPLTKDIHTHKLFTSLQKHWEPLPFLEDLSNKDRLAQSIHFSIQLAFWVAKPYALGEIFDHLAKHSPFAAHELSNVLFSLIHLGSWGYAKEKLALIADSFFAESSQYKSLQMAIGCHERSLNEVFVEIFGADHLKMDFAGVRTLLYFFDQALEKEQTQWIYEGMKKLNHHELSFETHLQLNTRWIWACLLDENWQAAEELLYAYPLDFLNKESTLLHFLYGCWLRATEGRDIAIIHFTGLLHVSYPRSWTLAGHYLTSELKLQDPWFEKAFLWEKRQLYKQLHLYYHCGNKKDLSLQFQRLYQEQFIYVDS